MDYEKDVDRLYQRARAVRAELEALWKEAQTTDVAVKGAVSAAQNDGLSGQERQFAISIGAQNAEKWRELARLSEKLGGLLDDIEQAKRRHEDG